MTTFGPPLRAIRSGFSTRALVTVLPSPPGEKERPSSVVTRVKLDAVRTALTAACNDAIGEEVRAAAGPLRDAHPEDAAMKIVTKGVARRRNRRPEGRPDTITPLCRRPSPRRRRCQPTSAAVPIPSGQMATVPAPLHEETPEGAGLSRRPPQRTTGLVRRPPEREVRPRLPRWVVEQVDPGRVGEHL